MTNQYLVGWRLVLVTLAFAGAVMIPVTDALAAGPRSIQNQVGSDTGSIQRSDDETLSTGDETSALNSPRLYPRATYAWPFASGPFYGVNARQSDPDAFITPVGVFKLSGSQPVALPTALRKDANSAAAQYYVVQMHPELQVAESARGNIERMGGVIVDEISRIQTVARLTQGAYAELQNTTGVMAIVPFQPAYKLHPSIGRIPLLDPIKAMSDVYTLDVGLWPGENTKLVAQAIAEMGGNVLFDFGDSLRIELNRSLLADLAAIEAVQIVREYASPVLLGEETTTTMQTGQYNAGAIPYHDAGVRGDGGGFGFCDNFDASLSTGTGCRLDSDCTGIGDQLCHKDVFPAVQTVMVLDSGIQLDAGDLSDTKVDPGTASSGHRKVQLYESTSQFPGGQGDLLGCDAPPNGGSTHGHIVAATAVGNGTDVDVAEYGAIGFTVTDIQGEEWNVDGVAPRARLIAYDAQVTPPAVSCADPNNTGGIAAGDLYLDQVTSRSLLNSYNLGARIVNFSWGIPSTATYNANSNDIDAFIRFNRDAMVFVAAGNSGADDLPAPAGDGIPDEDTLGDPAATKNGLAIGASRNANTVNSPESRAFFSSMGPVLRATVNRIAPQLMAPGDEPGGGSLGLSSEFSCRSNDNDQSSPVLCDVIAGVEGTSFAAPAAAGAGALVRDYFAQGFYPGGVGNKGNAVATISGALVKAVLIASADYMTGVNLTRAFRWNNEQGYGRIQLDNALPLEQWSASPSGLVVHDGQYNYINSISLPSSISAGNTETATFTVCDDEEELRIALSWTDNSNAQGNLRNNLDLEVISPSGKRYRGNYFTDDNDQNGTIGIGEDCPSIGESVSSGVRDASQWSLPVCANTKILGIDPPNNLLDFDGTNVTEAIFLSPLANAVGQNPQIENGLCDALASANAGGACGNAFDCAADPNSLAANDICEGGGQQTEVGEWTIEITAGAFNTAAVNPAVAIAGGVCLGSAVRLDAGNYTCNADAAVVVTEFAEVDDTECTNPASCPTSEIDARTTVRVYRGNPEVEVDCEGPGCTPASGGLTFAQPNPNNLRFESNDINLTDGTAPDPGNGVLDVRDGDRIEVTYQDKKFGANDVERKNNSTVACQVRIGFGSITFGAFGQDRSTLVQGGCERAEVRQGESVGKFEYGFPDRFMDANELIQYNFAFNSEETQALNETVASLACVVADADSPADCLPNGSSCDPVECGGTCDPRRENNPACPYMTILDSPKRLGRIPAAAAISGNFAIQMADDAVFAGTSPTVEMILGVTASVAGKTARGLAIQRERLNIDLEEKLYSTDYPNGATTIERRDLNNNEVEDNPITDLSGFQGLDYRFETRTFNSITTTGRNQNLLSPWDFDGDNGGFTAGLISATDQSAISDNIANWSEDTNFNGIQDGTCQIDPGTACYNPGGTDPRCPVLNQTCQSIENGNVDGAGTFTENWSTAGGCGWQTRPPHFCTGDNSRGCFVSGDCQGRCETASNSLISSFSPCSNDGECGDVGECAGASPVNAYGPCTGTGDCGGGACNLVGQTCEGEAGSCDLGSTMTSGGVWHTGPIGGQAGDCQNVQCQRYDVITTDGGQLLWWELLVTPLMEKVDQSETLGVPNSVIEIRDWAWNSAIDLADSNVAYTWELDTDTEKLLPVDLFSDATVFNSGFGTYGAVSAGNNPDLSNGWMAFAPVGNCQTGTGACRITQDCAAGACSTTTSTSCHFDAQCPKGICQLGGEPCNTTGDCTVGGDVCLGGETCENEDICVLTDNSTNGAAGNSRVGRNSCFFEGLGVIAVEDKQALGLARPRDDDLDQDSDAQIDEYVTAAGPIRNSDIVQWNGPDMRLGTLEDIYGDTGNTFQGAVGLLNLEGTPSDLAAPSYGLAIDDMVVEWAEFNLQLDSTDCDTGPGGSCAAIEVQSTNLFEGNGVVAVSVLEKSPYGVDNVNDCQLDGDFSDTGYCANTVPVSEGGTFSYPGIKQCSAASAGTECRSCSAGSANAGGTCTNDAQCFGGTCTSSVACVANTRYADDQDCDDDGATDIVVKAFSEAELEGEVLVLNNVGGSEYRGDLTISTLVDSADILFMAESGGDLPTVTVRYFDADDGTGVKCANDVIDADAGNVETATTVFINTCDIAVVGSSITDNGDGDLFADTNETVDLNISVVNNCGTALTGCFARLASNSPEVECIKTPVIAIGNLADTTDAVPVASPFVFKIGNVSRASATDAFSAKFNISIACNEIDAISSPQSLSLPMDLNLSDAGQTPVSWSEGFEGGTLGKFETMNLDAGIPGNSDPEGVANADGWRCSYNDPDWVNGSSYGNDAALVCYPSNNLAQSNQTFFHADGPNGTGGNTYDEGRAFTGSFSMAYNLPAVTYADPTTPLSTVDAARTTAPINLGVNDPELSFWHQISLLDGRSLGTVPFTRTSERGKVQIQVADTGTGAPSGDWTNLAPFQNVYDTQAVDNFFNCMFDPVDDGTTEDDFFDPTDPDRDDGPSSTCFPEFTYSCMGDTTTAAFPGPACNEGTPPDPMTDIPSWGAGTWVKSRFDLSEFRGRRARLRFLVTSIKVADETWEEQFFDTPDPRDDGWFIDDVIVDEVLVNPAQFVVDDHDVASCSISGNACVGRCQLAQNTTCTLGGGECVGAGDECVNPCGAGEGTCTGPTPECGAVCTTVTTNVFVEPAELNNPASVSTAAPGQVVAFNAAAAVDPETPASTPSVADSCLSGSLQYRFCVDGDDNADCSDAADTIIRNWTDNASLSVAPQVSTKYTTEVRCSTAVGCIDAVTVDVNVGCPGGVNGLSLQTLLATKAGAVTNLVWNDPLLVRVATGPFANLRADQPSGPYGLSSSSLEGDVCSPSSTNPGAACTSNADCTGPSGSCLGVMETLMGTTNSWYLVRLQGTKNTKEEAYHCNSRTYRSGGSNEVSEDCDPPISGCSGRDSTVMP